MRALIQRVKKARIDSDCEELGRIARGLVVFLGIASGDLTQDAHYIVGKVINLRIFEDELGRFNRSALEIDAELLIVSQFTLHADTRKGRRPSFSKAAHPNEARALFEKSLDLFSATGLKVSTGRFQESMQITLQNDGPITILIDSADQTVNQRTLQPY